MEEIKNDPQQCTQIAAHALKFKQQLEPSLYYHFLFIFRFQCRFFWDKMRRI